MTEPEVLTGEDLIEVLEETMPEYPDFIDEVREFVIEQPSTMGYSVAETTCSYCGEISLAVYAVPTPFPTECPYCHQPACYITSVPHDGDEDD